MFLYTGEGQVGDMEFVRGNCAIRDHASNGRDLLLFEALEKGKGYRSLGTYGCASYEFRRGPDKEGADGRVIVFHLVPLDSEADAPTTTQPSPAGAGSATLETLRDAAYAAAEARDGKSAKEAKRVYYERSAAVRDYVLARAQGVCEACRKQAPFERTDGNPYLEPHHTRRVSDGGPDHPRYVAAVCPNCHREIHFGMKGADLNRVLEGRLAGLESNALFPRRSGTQPRPQSTLQDEGASPSACWDKCWDKIDTKGCGKLRCFSNHLIILARQAGFEPTTLVRSQGTELKLGEPARNVLPHEIRPTPVH